MIWFAQMGMSGRVQALLLTIFTLSSALFAWLGAALVGLVTLRRGFREGAFLMFWGTLPALFLYTQIGDPNPLAQLVGTFILASVLRQTVSLTLTTLLSIPLGIVFSVLLLWFSSPVIDHVVEAFGELILALGDQMENAGQSVFFNSPDAKLVAGMIGVVNSAAVLICLFLSRFWQAALYNPGGFGVEFRALRYSAVVAFPLAIGFAVLLNLDGFQSWAGFLGLPLTVSGIALVHAHAARYWSLKGPGLFIFYFIWVITDYAKLALILLAVIDSAYDFRRSWVQRNIDSESDKDDESDDH